MPATCLSTKGQRSRSQGNKQQGTKNTFTNANSINQHIYTWLCCCPLVTTAHLVTFNNKLCNADQQLTWMQLLPSVTFSQDRVEAIRHIITCNVGSAVGWEETFQLYKLNVELVLARKQLVHAMNTWQCNLYLSSTVSHDTYDQIIDLSKSVYCRVRQTKTNQMSYWQWPETL